jgi:IS30 family transposase
VRRPEIESRIMPGHLECEFIMGAGNRSAVGVLLERFSCLGLWAEMDDATAASVLSRFAAKLNSIVAPRAQEFDR